MANLRHHRPLSPPRPGCCAARSRLRHRARPTSALGIPSRNAAILAPERSKKTSSSIFCTHSMFVASLTSALATDTRHSRATRSSAMRNRTHRWRRMAGPMSYFAARRSYRYCLGWPLGRLFYTRLHPPDVPPVPSPPRAQLVPCGRTALRAAGTPARPPARDGRPNATGRHLARAHR